MPMDDEFLRGLERVGFTASDVLSVLRPNSALDRVIVSVRCPQCLKEVACSLRDLYVKEGRCSCGAAFEDKPWSEDLKLYLRGHRGPFKAICFLPEPDEGTTEN